MRNKKLAVLGIAALTLTLATGCAKPPQQEIDGLKADLAAAETAEAPKYAADAWNGAQQAMNEVTAETEAQQNKFALFRSYTKTKELVAAADQKANEAKDAAVAGKEQAKNDANAALAAAQASLDQATQLMTDLGSCRRQPKDFKKDMEAMKGNLDGLAAQVAGIQSAIASEDYFGAKSQADSLKSSADGLVTDMQNAKAKIHC
jgi:chromosome segregation ATPase